MVQPGSMRIRFRDLELDEGRLLLCREGRPVAIRPKVFDLLVHLLTHRDRVVLREELVLKLWGTTAVGPGSLAGLVNELRQILGERGRGSSSIRTVHARGYQFVAPVEVLGSEVEKPRRSGPGLALAAEPRRLRAPADPDRSAVADLVGRRLARVESDGAQAVILEGMPGPDRVALLDFGSSGIGRAGFGIHRLPWPEGKELRSADLATRIFTSLIEYHGIDELRALDPGRSAALMARAERSARGRALLPRDPLAARQVEEEAWRGLAELLRALARRNPIALVIEAIDAGQGGTDGSRWLPFLLRVLGKSRVFLFASRTRETDSAARGRAGPGEAVEADPRVAVLPLAARDGSDSKGDPEIPPPLPTALTTALIDHLQREPARLPALVVWLESEQARAMLAEGVADARAIPARAAEGVDARPRGRRMRRVEPGGARPRSQAGGKS